MGSLAPVLLSCLGNPSRSVQRLQWAAVLTLALSWELGTPLLPTPTPFVITALKLHDESLMQATTAMVEDLWGLHVFVTR